MTLFSRGFQIDIDEASPGVLALTTHMTDRFHDISVVLEVELPHFAICGARAVMARVPHEACYDALPHMESLVGLRIGPGFSRRVADLVGGSNGCVNLRQMVQISAPLAINVSWFAYKARDGISDEEFERLRRRDMGGHCIAYPKALGGARD